MTWITETEIRDIRDRVAHEAFTDKKTHTYFWYVRFFWFGLAALWFVASVVTLGHDRGTVEGLVLCLLAGAYYQVQWRRHCEKYVLHLEIKKTEMSNKSSDGIRQSEDGLPKPSR